MSDFSVNLSGVHQSGARLGKVSDVVKRQADVVSAIPSQLGSIGLGDLVQNVEMLYQKLHDSAVKFTGLNVMIEEIIRKYNAAEDAIMSEASPDVITVEMLNYAGGKAPAPTPIPTRGGGGGHSHGKGSDDEDGHGGGGHRHRVARAQCQEYDPNSGLPDGYTYAEDMRDVPINKNLWDRIYGENGLAYLHGTEKAPDGYEYKGLMYVAGATYAKMLGLTSGELLYNYLFGDGSDYYYDATQLLVNSNVYNHAIDNLTEVASNIDSMGLVDGDSITISVSGMTGCESFIEGDGWKAFANAGLHANAFATINAADAGITCTITRTGDTYKMEYNYYIVDYYDWDKNVLEEMYNLNSYGYAHNFLGIGETSGTMTWEAGSGEYKNNFDGILGK